MDDKFAAVLGLPQPCNEEEISPAIVALLTSAVYDSEPLTSLKEVYQIITKLTQYLDPLNMLPMLLPCNDPAARDIISLIGECASAKEVVMTVQEAAERLERAIEAEDEQEDDDDATPSDASKLENESEVRTRQPASSMGQLLTMIDLYASAIPRLKLRRKSASDILKPLFEDLEKLLNLASQRATQEEGRSAISGTARLVTNAWTWAEANSPEDKQGCKDILKSLLDCSSLACGFFINTSIAQRTLEKCYPRLVRPSKSSPAWQEGERVVYEILDAYKCLGYSSGSTTGTPSASDLILYAYRPPSQPNPPQWLSFLLPPLLSSIQTNTFLDETLAVLIKSLHTLQTSASENPLSHNVTLPLCGLLPSLASAHPDPAIRNQAFRVLSLLLASGEPQLRFQLLVELARDSEYPQMRVASVGLVKEALLQSLSGKGPKDNPFCGPIFLRTFGPILFRSDPPDLLTSELSLKDFQETPEPGRLVECLSLYYVLLQRDEHNLTGIRDKDVLASIERGLLSPLRTNIDRWMSDPAVSNSHLHDITPVVSLKISLERVDAARENLFGRPTPG